MADSILFNVAANFITQLGSSTLRELGSLWGVNHELENYKILSRPSKQQSVSHAIKDWISKVTDVFYDVGDLIDEFSYETLRRQVLTKDRTINPNLIRFHLVRE
ncbi:putative disease resistance protein RGA4 [Cucumis melo var. makuwa]|uniref:Disease resistance protein RGA4 n=1 Tax=Cucumis melo var. makuwa TaxID=1194695 RepID=A0A5A7UTV5_CUCMM|nr:putative disease resistance protein RGA4 [Cucumis melo var. makuwa]TYK10395.1 putative disease resistance protein RGA4 [Cucumis melo var. makuwa]